MPWQFAAFGVLLYVAITLLQFWSWSPLRYYEALRGHINMLLVLAFLHYECVCVYISSSTHITLIFPANFTSVCSAEGSVSHSLLLCIWRWI